MASRYAGLAGWVLACGLAAGLAQAGAQVQKISQAQTASQAQTTEEALHSMSRRAGVIFTGQVVGVRRLAGEGAGVVEIEFRVDDTIRGVRGGKYAVREWAGLWPGGETPFVVGQRYLMLLHAPGRGGLSSPVGGMDGAIPLVAGAISSADATGKSVEQATGLIADMRWVSARVARTVTYAPEPAPMPRSAALASAKAAASMRISLPVGSAAGLSLDPPAIVGGPLTAGVLNVAPTAAYVPKGPSYSSVLGMLRGWEEVDHGAH